MACHVHVRTLCIIPVGSHKSNIRHPFQDPDAGHPQLLWRCDEPFARRHGKAVQEGGFMDGVPGAAAAAAAAVLELAADHVQGN